VVLQECAGSCGGVGTGEAKRLADEGATEASSGSARVVKQWHEVAEHYCTDEEEEDSSKGNQQHDHRDSCGAPLQVHEQEGPGLYI
jgi:hypothetical protein